MAPSDAPLTVELYVRSLSPPGARGELAGIIDRVRDLADGGPIDEWSVLVWGKQLCPTGPEAETEVGSHALQRIDQFRSWADERDLCLQSTFGVRHVDSEMSGEAYVAVTFPVVAMAEFIDGDLRFVAPCSEDETTHTVLDRLDALEAGTIDGPAEHDDAPPVTNP